MFASSPRSLSWRRCLCIGFFFAAVTSGGDALAGPWTPEPGKYYVQAAGNYFGSSDRRSTLLNVYGEYGLRDGLAFVGTLPLTVGFEQPNGRGRFVALAPSVGLRWRIIDGPLLLSTQADAALPLTGGPVDFTAQLLTGSGFSWLSGFWQAGAGYRARTGAGADEVIFNADVGFWIARPLLVVLEGAGRVQLGGTGGDGRGEQDYQLGTQWIWRANPHVDFGVDLRYTLRATAVRDGLGATGYIAFRN